MQGRFASSSRGVWPRIRATLFALVLIGMVTLTPFRFGSSPQQAFDFSLLAARTTLEFVANILLFALLGHALAGFAYRAQRWARLFCCWLGAVCVGAAVSVTVEYWQCYLPRNPGLSDVLSNVLGVGVGARCRLWPDRWPIVWWRKAIVSVRRRASAGSMLIATGVGVLVAGVVGLIGFRAGTLDNWRAEMPLVIGDEVGGGRGFRGMVGAIELAAGSVRGGYDEERRPLGEAPSLGMVGAVAGLASGWPAWSEQARHLDAFSVGVTVRSMTEQAGPARILSWSAGPFERNLTIAQSGRDLVVRVRSTVTGANGESPALRVRGAFDAPGRVRSLRVDHDGGVTRVLVDGVPHSFRATPFVAWLKPFQALEAWEMASLNAVGFAFLVLPLAALGAACWRCCRRQRRVGPTGQTPRSSPPAIGGASAPPTPSLPAEAKPLR